MGKIRKGKGNSQNMVQCMYPSNQNVWNVDTCTFYGIANEFEYWRISINTENQQELNESEKQLLIDLV